MTQYTRADVDMADRHIALGEHHISQQELLISKLQMQNHSTKDAEKLLAVFYSTMVEHRTHRATIIEALEAAGL